MRAVDVRNPANRRSRFAVLLWSFFLLAYLLPLGVRPLFVPDETRYGEIPREMITSGDWIVPHLNGVRYFEKPVLGYWVHAGALLLFGENNFAVRLPAALAVGLSALIIFGLMRRLSRPEDDFSAFLAALVYLSCFEVFGVGNTAVLDNLFSFFLTATIALFYLASEERPGSIREKGFLVLSGIACGVAFLTKGFLAFAVPVLALAPYLAWQRRYKDLFRMSLLPILVAVITALPWALLIHLKEPDFWRFFFWNEHIRRFLAEDAQHKQSFWFFFLMAPAMFVPWAFVVPAAGWGIKARLAENEPENRLLKLCICWLVLPFCFFSISKGKLLTYILPCFPPFAVLMAFGLFQVLKKDIRNKIFQGGVGVYILFFGLILVAFIYLQIIGFNGFRPYKEAWKAVMAVNSLVFLLLAGFWTLQNRRIQTKLVLFGIAPLLLFFLAHFIIPGKTIEAKAPGPFLQRHIKGIPPGSVILSDDGSIRAVCWYLKRDDVYLLGGAGETEYGLRYQDAGGRWLTPESALKLIHRNPGKTVLIARARNVSQWEGLLPRPAFQDQSGPTGYVFWKY